MHHNRQPDISSASSSAVPSSSLRVMSWNVAGWTSTASIVRNIYNGKLSAFLNALGCDILCLQEVKGGAGGMKKLRADPVNSGACDASGSGFTIPGWETFWAHADTKFRGFNGVGVFAKAGLVVAADPAPLRVPELDAEGRCMLAVTRHFAVFSVYAPCNSGGPGRFELRTKFFAALADAVQRVRQQLEMPVAVCGDLNATYRVSDVHWSWRRFSLLRLRDGRMETKRAREKSDNDDDDDDDRDDNNHSTDANRTSGVEEEEEEEKDEEEGALIQWPPWFTAETRRRRVDEVVALSQQREKNTALNNVTLQQRQLLLQQQQQQQHQPATRQGDAGSSQQKAATFFGAAGAALTKKNSFGKENDALTVLDDDVDDDNDDGDNPLCEREGVLALNGDEGAGEVEKKKEGEQETKERTIWGLYLFVPSDLTTATARAWYAVAMSPAIVQVNNFLTDVIFKQTGLIDSLVYVHGSERTRGLFTCFNQARNERYSGVGQRIDYVLCDQELLPPPQHAENDVVNGDEKGRHNNNNNNQQQQQQQYHQVPMDEFHGGALWKKLCAAATCDGAFVAAPPLKGAAIAAGLAPLTRRECDLALHSCYLPALPEHLQMQQLQQQPDENRGRYLSAGVLYTAPQLSDHVAVFCDLQIGNTEQQRAAMARRSVAASKHLQDLSAATKLCKYDSGVKSIASFFTSAASTSTATQQGKTQKQQRQQQQRTQRQQQRPPPRHEAPQIRQRGATIDDCIEIDDDD